MDSIITFINTTGKSFIDFSTSMLIQSSVLIILLLLLDLLLRKKVRAVFLYCIWLLVLVKLVLPTTLSSPTGLGYWAGVKVPGIITEKASVPKQTASILQRIEPVSETISSGTRITALLSAGTSPEPTAETSAKFTVAASPATASLSRQGFAFLGWLAVVIAMVVLLIRRMFFVRGLLAQSKNPNDSMVVIFERCRKQMGVHGSIFLKLSPVAASPSVCGLFRPTILIPQNLPGKLKAEDLKSILLHELAHINRGDLWVSLIQTILQVAYFYNPLLWVANAIIRKVREQAVDEMVLVAMGEQAEDYPETLLNISRLTFSRPVLSLRLIGIIESKKALHRRIKLMLNRPIPKNAKLGTLGLLVVIITGAILLPMAKAQKQSVDNTAAVSDSDKNGSTDLSEAKLKTSLNAVDSDGDGLSDFQEVHKYLTDPAKRDTDSDGLPDGDWNERREYTYSVRTILKFMPPFDKAALNDDYQDALVLEETDNYIEIEVIHYPLATLHESIEENPNWQRDYAGMTEYLKTGVTTNWDAKMKQDLLTELRVDGILIDKLTDKQVVERVSSWLMKRSRSLDKVFTTYYVHFPNGQPSVYPGLEGAFEHEFGRDKENYDWTMNQHFDHELLGKGMFYNKTHGSCTSFAVYLTTVLRALGIPTRMIIVTPAVDASNKEQLPWAKDRITHNKVRETMLTGSRRSMHGFTAHTFNEVFVGNHWHRLNYSRLGQPILDEQCFGLHTHLYTFNDLSEANLAPTWGFRYGKGLRSAIFKHSNPYTAVTLSDLFGCHSNIPNPPFTAKDLPSSQRPNIFILEPSRIRGKGFSMSDEVFSIVKYVTWNNINGYNHKKEVYDNIFDGRYNSGDTIVLLFSLDTKERIPKGYEDLLPKPWSEIEPALKQGKTAELTGKARKMNVILLAAPKREQLKQLIQESKLLRFKKKEQIEEHKPSAGKTRSGFSATLPSGATIELVGVCYWPKEDKKCWLPDGAKLLPEIYVSKWNVKPGFGDYGFMFKVGGVDDFNFSYKIEGAGRSEGSCQVVDAKENKLEGFEAVTSDMKEGQSSTIIRIGIATGPWNTIASHEGKRMEIGRQGGVLWSQAFRSYSGTHIVASREWRKDQVERVIAIDKDGKIYTTSHGSVASGKIDQLTASFRNLKLEQIEEFLYQVRPYQWVEFKNVSLLPGHKTDVEF